MSGAEGGLQRSPRCRLSEVEGWALKFKKRPRGQLPAMDETGVRDWEDGWSQEARHCPGLAPHVRWKGCRMQRRPKPEELLSKLNLQGNPASGHGGRGGVQIQDASD